MAGNIDVEALSPALPDWLRNGTRPPSIPLARWKTMPEAERQAVLDTLRNAWIDWLNESPARAAWNIDALREATGLFFSGLPKDGQAAAHPVSAGDYGKGVVGEWKKFAASPAVAQYLNLRKMLGSIRFPEAHFNLCGELAVMATLGIGLEAGLRTFTNLPTGDGDDILADSSRGTLGSKLAEFYIFAGAALDARFFRAENLAQPSPLAEPPQLLQMLDEGKKLVMLVNIDTAGNKGQLKPMAASNKKVAHWAALLDVTTAQNEQVVLRMYNSFHNQEEFYTWPALRGAWKETNGNSSKYGMVIAEPM